LGEESKLRPLLSRLPCPCHDKARRVKSSRTAEPIREEARRVCTSKREMAKPFARLMLSRPMAAPSFVLHTQHIGRPRLRFFSTPAHEGGTVTLYEDKGGSSLEDQTEDETFILYGNKNGPSYCTSTENLESHLFLLTAYVRSFRRSDKGGKNEKPFGNPRVRGSTSYCTSTRTGIHSRTNTQPAHNNEYEIS
jgi:hypothetical protein